jgi:hypothetical protein
MLLVGIGGGTVAQHISIRIPWKDNGYAGLVCAKPCHNNSCLRLKNIADNRDDNFEKTLAGCTMTGRESKIPCVSEGGAFMSEISHFKTTIHPYKESNPATHGHFLETDLIYPPFSLPARPFAWTMLRKGRDKNDANVQHLTDRYNIEYESSREPILPFSTNWVQDAANQRAIFKTFFQDVIPAKSLVVAYAKQVPFVEDAKRVVMGIGFVNSITEPPEHNHTNTGELRSILWETMIGHTIRHDRANGFLFPYHEMIEYVANHPDFDIRTVTVFADDDYFEEFSYATEHLSYDAVISVLLQTIKTLAIIKDCIPGNWQECIDWANTRLKEVWLDRGAFPGLGAMLCAMGFKYGIVIANEIKNRISGNISYEKFVCDVLRNPQNILSTDIAASIKPTEQNAFLALSDERKNLFWLLARVSLTTDKQRHCSIQSIVKKQVYTVPIGI